MMRRNLSGFDLERLYRCMIYFKERKEEKINFRPAPLPPFPSPSTLQLDDPAPTMALSTSFPIKPSFRSYSALLQRSNSSSIPASGYIRSFPCPQPSSLTPLPRQSVHSRSFSKSPISPWGVYVEDDVRIISLHASRSHDWVVPTDHPAYPLIVVSDGSNASHHRHLLTHVEGAYGLSRSGPSLLPSDDTVLDRRLIETCNGPHIRSMRISLDESLLPSFILRQMIRRNQS